MADLKEARVPDLGGSSEVPVIELLVKVGDTVKKDQGLVTLESDKATMEVPVGLRRRRARNQGQARRRTVRRRAGGDHREPMLAPSGAPHRE
jgi:multidrug efflux pump subunit AcrA (membrane-fusion protein)